MRRLRHCPSPTETDLARIASGRDGLRKENEKLRKKISSMLEVFAKIEMALYDEQDDYAYIKKPGLDALRSITASSESKE